MIKERLNIYAVGDDDLDKMRYMLLNENDMFITGINNDVNGHRGLAKLKNSNIDMLGDSKLNL